MFQAQANFQEEALPNNSSFTQGLIDMVKEKQAKKGGGLWGLLGPLGDLVGQTFDGKSGINWGQVGNAAANNAIAGVGVMTGNPALISAGVGRQLRG